MRQTVSATSNFIASVSVGFAAEGFSNASRALHLGESVVWVESLFFGLLDEGDDLLGLRRRLHATNPR